MGISHATVHKLLLAVIKNLDDTKGKSVRMGDDLLDKISLTFPNWV